jgi:hypothetical protein
MSLCRSGSQGTATLPGPKDCAIESVCACPYDAIVYAGHTKLRLLLCALLPRGQAFIRHEREEGQRYSRLICAYLCEQYHVLSLNEGPLKPYQLSRTELHAEERICIFVTRTAQFMANKYLQSSTLKMPMI